MLRKAVIGLMLAAALGLFVTRSAHCEICCCQSTTGGVCCGEVYFCTGSNIPGCSCKQ